MSEDRESEAVMKQPELLVPGWAIRVYVEASISQGRNALEKAILGLMKAGVAGLPSALSDLLVIDEKVVEIALNQMEDEGILKLEGKKFCTVDNLKEEDESVEVRYGWMFWEPLRQTALPVLMLDELLLKNSHSTIEEVDKELESCSNSRPRLDAIRDDLLSIVAKKEFSIIEPSKPNSPSNASGLTSRDLRRVSPISGPKSIRWYPLLIPYQVEPTLGSQAEIYFMDPVCRVQEEGSTAYNPYLGEVIGKVLPHAIEIVRNYASQLQTRYLQKQAAPFLDALGGRERVDADAHGAVVTMLGGSIPKGKFGNSTLVSAAKDAEVTRILVEPMKLGPDALRNPFSRVLQILGKVIADDIGPRWKNQEHKIGSAPEWDKYYTKKPDKNPVWKSKVKQFDQVMGTGISTWNTAPPWDHCNKATFSNGWKLSQLGTVLRSLGALAVTAKNERDGQFCLQWIRASVDAFPDLFNVFEKIKEQRNTDKNSSSYGIPVEEYRAQIYQVWSAIGFGHESAVRKMKIYQKKA